MKKLLYFFLLFFFVGCSEAPKEQQIVMEYLKYNPDNIRRYKPLEWGKLDTIYSDVGDNLFYMRYFEEYLEVKMHVIKLEQAIIDYGTDPFYVKHLQEGIDYGRRLSEEYQNKMDSIERNHIPHLTGYSIRHKYRAKKNTDNEVVYDEVFVLDSTLTKVVEVKKL